MKHFSQDGSDQPLVIRPEVHWPLKHQRGTPLYQSKLGPLAKPRKTGETMSASTRSGKSLDYDAGDGDLGVLAARALARVHSQGGLAVAAVPVPPRPLEELIRHDRGKEAFQGNTGPSPASTSRRRSCRASKPRTLLTFDPNQNDVDSWMKFQRTDGSVLIEDHHDQYARTGIVLHRLNRFLREGNEIKDVAARHDALLSILRHVNDEFVAMNITYTLWAGTLLGAYRHHSIIPWDDDVDIAISGEDTKRLRMIMIERAKLEISQRGSSLRNATSDESANTVAETPRYQWIIRARKDSDIIVAKVADVRNGYYVDIFNLYRNNGADFVSTFFKSPKCFPVEAMIPSRPCVLGSHIYECAQDPEVVLTINYPNGLEVPSDKMREVKYGAVYEGIIDSIQE